MALLERLKKLVAWGGRSASRSSAPSVVFENTGVFSKLKTPTKKKRVLMLFAGGTIAMARGPDGALKPALSPNELYAKAPAIRDHVDFTFHKITDKDSSNMTRDDWVAIAKKIHDEQHNYDAIIVTHGTDTMAYTGNAVAMALGRTLKIPVIFTGAMKAPDEMTSDVKHNLEQAVVAATQTWRPEVMISMGTKILRAVRTRKVHEAKMESFDTPAEQPLAENLASGLKWHVDPNPKVRAHHDDEFLPFFSDKVVTVNLEPGMHPELINRGLLGPGGWLGSLFRMFRAHTMPEGLIWQTLGSGNVPEVHHPTIVDAHREGVLIGATSGFAGSHVDMDAYEPGKKAKELGVIPAADMTAEAASTKMKWAIGVAKHYIGTGRLAEKDYREFVTHLFLKNRAGELSAEDGRGFLD